MMKPVPPINSMMIRTSHNTLIAGIKTGIRIINHFSILP